MMISLNLNSVMEDLGTPQVEKQVPALEQAAEIVNSVAREAVETLRRGPNRFLVAERLNRLGSVVVPHLERLLKESDDSETRILAALVLLQFDSRVGVPCLLDAVNQDEDYAGLVAEHLAKAGIDQAIEPIIKRLRNCKLQEVDLVLSLLDALAKLGGILPYDLQQRLSDVDVPWQISTMYTRNFAFQTNHQR
jgi:HEAT repeat protein